MIRRHAAAAIVFALTLLLVPPLAMRAVAASCGIEGIERIVAVGDAHGAYDRYVGILKTAGLIDEQRHWIGGHTHFVQTGDLVDRGTGSRQILDLLQALEPEAAAAGGAVHVLLGNHEVMRMLGDLRYVIAADYEAFTTAESADLRRRYAESASSPEAKAAIEAFPLGSIELRLAFGPNGTYGKWLRTLDTVASINRVLFVHGGISPAVAPMPCATINDTVRRELTTDFNQTLDNPLSTLAAREDGPLWYRGLAQEPDEFAPAVAAMLSAQGASAIVVGHTPTTTRRIRVRFNGTVFQIDTGMLQSYVPDGRASAIEIKAGRFTAIYEDGRAELESRALEVSPK
jgi:hypothetical protein